jgi:alpha-L-fucosidase 2
MRCSSSFDFHRDWLLRFVTFNMRTFALIAATVLVVAQVPSPALAGPPLEDAKGGDWQTLKLRFDSPAPEDNFLGNPIGNGHIGAKIKGGVGTETIQLNDKWFWTGGPGFTPPDPKRRLAMEETPRVLAAGDIPAAEQTAKGMWGSNEMGTFLPLGTLSIAFDHGAEGSSGYARELDLDRAVSTVTCTVGGVTYTREAFASFPDDVIVLRVSSNTPGKVSVTAKLAYPVEMQGNGGSVSADAGATRVMKGRAPANEGWHPEKGMRFEARLKPVVQGSSASVAVDGSLRVENADSVVLIFANATSYNGFDKEPGTQGVDPAPRVSKALDAAAGKSYDELLEAHIADHQSLFRRVWAEVNGEKPNAKVMTFQYARYDMIATSREQSAL